MERSLTVLLPVHNAQSTLADTVHEVLDVVSELTERFELVIIDDGSADATSEVADELIRCYPQVKVARHGRYLGREAAIHTGLQRSSGAVVLLRDETGGSATEAISRLWRVAMEHELFRDYRPRENSRQRTYVGAGSSARQAGYQMIDRRTFEQFLAPGRPAAPNYLNRLRDFTLGE